MALCQLSFGAGIQTQHFKVGSILLPMIFPVYRIHLEIDTANNGHFVEIKSV